MFLRGGMLHCFPAGMLSELFRYYATAVLDHVHRSKALEEWAKLGKGEEISLERALGSFDLFVLHDQHGDLLEV
jgi:F-box protein 21